MKHYRARHRSQLAASQSVKTHRQGCTWTTGANGLVTASGGRLRPSPDAVLRTVKDSEQTNPGTPGWSLPDLDLAVTRYSKGTINLDILSGWQNLIDYRNRGYYIALQGDSDVFTDGCMAVFDGLHCIGIHPDESQNRWRINDPLCRTRTHRSPEKIHEYARKLADQSFGGVIRFGVFKPSVPRID